jgi:hypothetical protein
MRQIADVNKKHISRGAKRPSHKGDTFIFETFRNIFLALVIIILYNTPNIGGVEDGK